MAKKTASRSASNAVKASETRASKKVNIRQLRDMLEQLQNELDDIETKDGPNRKTVTALTRIKDLLPLLRSCQESMTRP